MGRHAQLQKLKELYTDLRRWLQEETLNYFDPRIDAARALIDRIGKKEEYHQLNPRLQKRLWKYRDLLELFTFMEKKKNLLTPVSLFADKTAARQALLNIEAAWRSSNKSFTPKMRGDFVLLEDNWTATFEFKDESSNALLRLVVCIDKDPRINAIRPCPHIGWVKTVYPIGSNTGYVFFPNKFVDLVNKLHSIERGDTIDRLNFSMQDFGISEPE